MFSKVTQYFVFIIFNYTPGKWIFKRVCVFSLPLLRLSHLIEIAHFKEEISSGRNSLNNWLCALCHLPCFYMASEDFGSHQENTNCCLIQCRNWTPKLQSSVRQGTEEGSQQGSFCSGNQGEVPKGLREEAVALEGVENAESFLLVQFSNF